MLGRNNVLICFMALILGNDKSRASFLAVLCKFYTGQVVKRTLQDVQQLQAQSRKSSTVPGISLLVTSIASDSWNNIPEVLFILRVLYKHSN